uniref:Matrix protein n=1 Tax=La Piedad-Michoacan-Mexico virus TaxID=3052562 RepID=A0A0S2C5M0_LPMV|nr:matrix protein [Orthorubulavirus suis]ALN39195.1 matrix protein [Orthorubulavirus suis]ALN39196.1 matrix protein [Orthorubulavirus suis]ALO61984.1 matrix protein [Orthorubulavirus suis]ALO61985.1 matrix protein [Orthorubulavirus suis]
MAMHAKIPLNQPQNQDTAQLQPFPLVMSEPENGKRRLLKQLRIKRIPPLSIGDQQITFINTYGFIRASRTFTEFISELHRPGLQPIVTACMLPFGAGPLLDSPEKILEGLDLCEIKVRKSAAVKEEILFEVTALPKIFQGFQISAQPLIKVSSEKYVKAPGKINAGAEYKFYPTFVSLTYCPTTLKFKVARPLATVRAKFMRSIHLEILLIFECKDDAPMAKALIKRDERDGYQASVWVHMCNITKSTQKFKTYDDSYFGQKVLAMKPVIGLVDMWGPTITVHISGKMPKTAAPYFNSRGRSCHPLSEVAPSIAKMAWSNGCRIHQVNAILQESDLSLIPGSDDILFRKVPVDPENINFKSTYWNPFRK